MLTLSILSQPIILVLELVNLVTEIIEGGLEGLKLFLLLLQLLLLVREGDLKLVMQVIRVVLEFGEAKAKVAAFGFALIEDLTEVSSARYAARVYARHEAPQLGP